MLDSVVFPLWLCLPQTLHLINVRSKKVKRKILFIWMLFPKCDKLSLSDNK